MKQKQKNYNEMGGESISHLYDPVAKIWSSDTTVHGA